MLVTYLHALMVKLQKQTVVNQAQTDVEAQNGRSRWEKQWVFSLLNFQNAVMPMMYVLEPALFLINSETAIVNSEVA
jgi:hypothetical protein